MLYIIHFLSSTDEILLLETQVILKDMPTYLPAKGVLKDLTQGTTTPYRVGTARTLIYPHGILNISEPQVPLNEQKDQ